MYAVTACAVNISLCVCTDTFLECQILLYGGRREIHEPSAAPVSTYANVLLFPNASVSSSTSYLYLNSGGDSNSNSSFDRMGEKRTYMVAGSNGSAPSVPVSVLQIAWSSKFKRRKEGAQEEERRTCKRA